MTVKLAVAGAFHTGKLLQWHLKVPFCVSFFSVLNRFFPFCCRFYGPSRIVFGKGFE
jgi:hypothetical protein